MVPRKGTRARSAGTRRRRQAQSLGLWFQHVARQWDVAAAWIAGRRDPKASAGNEKRAAHFQCRPMCSGLHSSCRSCLMFFGHFCCAFVGSFVYFGVFPSFLGGTRTANPNHKHGFHTCRVFGMRVRKRLCTSTYWNSAKARPKTHGFRATCMLGNFMNAHHSTHCYAFAETICARNQKQKSCN